MDSTDLIKHENWLCTNWVTSNPNFERPRIAFQLMSTSGDHQLQWPIPSVEIQSIKIISIGSMTCMHFVLFLEVNFRRLGLFSSDKNFNAFYGCSIYNFETASENRTLLQFLFKCVKSVLVVKLGNLWVDFKFCFDYETKMIVFIQANGLS